VRGASTRCGGFDKQRDALAALEEIRSRDRRGVDVTRRVTVGGYLTEWLAGKRNLRATTLRSYRQHVEDYLVPHLGRLDITALRRAHVEAMFAAIDTEREQPGRRPMGAATKQRVRATLRSALHDAEREGLVTVNAARLVRLEAGRRPQVRPLEPDELGRLLDHLAGDELGPLFETIAATGLRRGEALGLRWSDVDLDRGVIAVRQQLVTLGGAESFQPPKTASGARRIELDSQPPGCCSTSGYGRTPTGRRGATRTSTAASCSPGRTVNRCRPTWSPSGSASGATPPGVRRVRLHDLRHGAASLRLAAGVDIGIVSKILGHSTIGITADTYSHLLEGVGREAAERAAALVPRAVKSSRETAGLPSGSRSSSSDEDAGVGSVNPQVSDGVAGAPGGGRTHTGRIFKAAGSRPLWPLPATRPPPRPPPAPPTHLVDVISCHEPCHARCGPTRFDTAGCYRQARSVER
jgi:integrase